MRLSLQEISELKVGDVLYESGSGGSIKIRITSNPVLDVIDTLEPMSLYGKKQYRWTAVKEDDPSVTIDYLITESNEHYGPKLYRDDPYISLLNLKTKALKPKHWANVERES